MTTSRLSIYYVTKKLIHQLTSTTTPPSVLLRSAFFPAILNSTIKPRNPELSKEADNKILNFFNSNPTLNVVIVQGSITNKMIKSSWNKEGSKEMENNFFFKSCFTF